MSYQEIRDRHESGPGKLHRCQGHAGSAWYPYAGQQCDANVLLAEFDDYVRRLKRDMVAIAHQRNEALAALAAEQDDLDAMVPGNFV